MPVLKRHLSREKLKRRLKKQTPVSPDHSGTRKPNERSTLIVKEEVKTGNVILHTFNMYLIIHNIHTCRLNYQYL